MRKRLLAGVAALLLAFSIDLRSSSQLFGNVDYPYQGILTTSTSFWVGGWEFNCSTGYTSPIVNVYFWDYNAQRYITPNFVVSTGLLRPDVQQFFVFQCPNVNSFTGWQVSFPTPVPPGRYRMWVTFAEYDYTQLNMPVEVTLQ